QSGDTQALRRVLGPLQKEPAFSSIDVFSADGREFLALHSSEAVPKVDPNLASSDVATNSVAGVSDQLGENWSGLVETSSGTMLFSGTPVKDTEGRIVGAVLVGSPFDDLVAKMAHDTL